MKVKVKRTAVRRRKRKRNTRNLVKKIKKKLPYIEKVSTVKSEDSLTLIHCTGMHKPFMTC